MGMLDNMDNQSKDVMNDPEKRAKIEQMAKDNGMSIEEAKAHFMQHSDQQMNQ